ncbi:MAG: electron transfer flavoprotein subunit alpha/FixB family protein, partial [Clostridia bacterium]|nr:electron transfer flavoprotein subunit alpha/FixB family protein [Clostridia bacterium]
CLFIKAADFRSVLESLTARTIKYNSDITQKSGRVCVVGDMTAEQIHFIADNYEKLPFSSPDEIAEKVKRINPDILLFPATAEGRETAPAVAAKLECGLCADCTGIEYDGEKMIMYRPAKGGDIIAKIVSNTRPQMATVRVNTDSVKNIIGVGMGASGRLAEIKELASALCAEICASRAAVDNGILPYECQVGLTGKQISPHIYIALGISGQIQHISGIMNAGYIIAVNSDKNARIFDYADFGIVSDISEFLANSKYKININGRK